jgi:hypothetical protein
MTTVPISLNLSMIGMRKDDIGSRGGGSVVSSTLNNVGPFHQWQMSGEGGSLMLPPERAAMGRNARSLEVL